MTRTLLVFLVLTATALAQGPDTAEVPDLNVSFDRILNSGEEPQNWLTYNGANNSFRHSELTQITPDNGDDLRLKWAFQSRSLEKHEVTPLVVDGVMYTVQSPNGVVALDAETGQVFWRYTHEPDPAGRNCCGRLTRGLAILNNTICG